MQINKLRAESEERERKKSIGTSRSLCFSALSLEVILHLVTVQYLL
jgi:hypothetical protein